MKTKKIIALLLAALLTFSLAACSEEGSDAKNEGGSQDQSQNQENASDSGGEKSKGTLGVITIALNNDYCIQLNDGVKKAAEENGYDVMTLSTNADAEKEVSALETLGDNGIKAAYALTVASDAIGVMKDEKYPDMGILFHGETEGETAHLVEDSAAVTSYFIDSLDAFVTERNITEGQVVLIFTTGAESEDARGHDSVVEAIDAIGEHFAGTGITYATVYYLDDSEQAGNIVETALNTFPDVKAFYCYNNDFAMVAANTISAAVPDCSDYFVFSSEGDQNSFKEIANASSPYRACASGDTVRDGYNIGLQLINWVENGEMENVYATKVQVDWRNIDEYIEK